MVSTTNADTAKDDRFDENGADATVPAANGVYSGIINLAYGSMPVNSSPTATTGENGFEAFMDDAADSSGIMTIDFAFEAPAGQPNAAIVRRDLSSNSSDSSAASTFTAWQSQNSLSGLNNPNDDPDADALTNLMEYALGTPANSGLAITRFRLEVNATTRAVDALVTRPAGEHRDLRYGLEGSDDLAAWTALAITPSLQVGSDQTETLRFANVTASFLRLKVTLDADLDGTPEASAITGVEGWSRRTFDIGRQTLSMPLLKPAVFTGCVVSVTGTQITLPVSVTLPAGAHYLEVLDGPLAGQTFDIDTHLNLPSYVALAGVRVAIRPHWTLDTLLPATALQSASAQDDADRVLFFDSATNSFQIHWVSATSTTPQWLRDDDTSARLISPQDGLFVQIRSTPATLTFLGTVRSTALALPQSAGTRFIGTGLATPLAPGAQPFTSGSRLRLWNGDTDPAAANYQNFLLNPQSQWIDEATGLDVTSQPLLDAFRAYFWVK